MSFVYNTISSDVISAFVYTLLHSLWQAPVIALIMFFALRRLPSAQSDRRHNTAMASLLLLCMVSIFTLLYYLFSTMHWGPGLSLKSTLAPPLPAMEATEATSTIATTQTTGLMTWINSHQYTIAITWLTGVFCFLLRVMAGHVQMHFIKKSVSYEIASEIELSLTQLCHKIGINKAVRIGVSTLTKTPMMIGHLKPIIILPLAAINHLSTSEVESIIAHELAHIYRNDFIKNIILLIIESFYFFNPAVWWMSSIMRAERENASDDTAIKMGVEKLLYIKTLVKLHELQMPISSRLALNMIGNKHSGLLFRIKRLMQQPTAQKYLWERGIALSLLLVSIIMAGSASSGMDHYKAQNLSPEVMGILPMVLPSSGTTLYAVGSKEAPSLGLKIKNGTIKEMKIDHKKIAPALYDTINIKKAAGIHTDQVAKSSSDSALRSIVINRNGDEYDIKIDTIDDDHLNKKPRKKNLRKITSNRSNINDLVERSLKQYRVAIEDMDMDDLRDQITKAMESIENIDHESLEELSSLSQEINEELIEEMTERHQDFSDIGIEIAEESIELSQALAVELSQLGISLAEEVAEAFASTDENRNYSRMARRRLQRDLADQIVADALWKGNKNNIVIDSTQLIINGAEQSSSMYKKYYRIIEKHLPEIKRSHYMRVSMTVYGRSLDEAEDVSLHISVE